MSNNKNEKYTFKSIPTLGIADYKTAIEFYVNFMGFTIDWEHRFSPSEPVYMQVSKCGLLLHFSENKRFQNPGIVFVESNNLQAFHTELLKKTSPIKVQDIAETKWGTWQFEIEDPFGNQLRFNENMAR
jgi:uncharacterized glyoxalase superfamily protein PhnB